MDTTSLFNYFKDLSETQKEQYNLLKSLYLDLPQFVHPFTY